LVGLSKAILKSTSLVGALTLLSRVTGLLREMVYAQVFGASALMDAFLVAIKIPNFLRRLFAEGSFSQGFVPVISEYRHKKTHGETRELVSGVAGTLAFTTNSTLRGGLDAPWSELLAASRGIRDLAREALRLAREPGWGDTCRARPPAAAARDAI